LNETSTLEPVEHRPFLRYQPIFISGLAAAWISLSLASGSIAQTLATAAESPAAVAPDTLPLSVVSVLIEKQVGADAPSPFQFNTAASPIKNDAAAGREFQIWGGSLDRASRGVSALSDGKVPTAEDQPSANFFWSVDSPGGRVLLDLGQPTLLERVCSYSWHPGERGDQVYTLYGSNGESESDEFEPQPALDQDPVTRGYRKLADVDTTQTTSKGDQVVAQLGSVKQPLGEFRYLLWKIEKTDANRRFSHTFFSEIDVVEVGTEGELSVVPRVKIVRQYTFDDDRYTIAIDTTDCPDLTLWTEKELLPEIEKWYPKIVELLPSDGFVPPQSMRLVFSDAYDGVAATSGDRMIGSTVWFRRQLQREAKGAIVHELVHVAQQYSFWRGTRGARRAPGWVVEGIADYIRWHLYEPVGKRGGVGGRSPAEMRHDASYRETASFLAWLVNNGHPEIVGELNAVVREGKYSDEFWINATGDSIDELAKQWNNSEAS